MASIGDLFLKVVADLKGFHTDVQKGAEKAGDAGGQTLGKRLSASLKKSWGGQEIGKGLVQGLGLAGGLGAATLFAGAISKIGDVLGDATQAALAEETSIQKLGTALKANVAGWDGNTAAIERTLQARMKLGFSDDEQRDSLARIVVATKDVNKALAIQRTAMDLARLKGISLAEAGEALIKVEGGQFRALKALGIQLPKNATATQALAAVTKAAAGQAEDYAETNAGKLLVSQVKMGEALEKLGAVTMPAFVAATGGVADAVTGLVTVIDLLNGTLPKTGDEMQTAGEEASGFLEALGALFPVFGVLGKAAKDEFGKINTSAHEMRNTTTSDLSDVETALDDTGEAATEMGKDIKMSANVGSSSFEEMRDDIIGAAEDIVGQAYDVLDNAAALSAANTASAEAQRVLASSKSSDALKNDARETLREVGRDQAKLVLDLTKAGAGGSAKVAAAIADMKKRLETATGQERKAILATLAALRLVEAQAKVTFRALVKTNAQIPRQTTDANREHRAAGGPTQANVPYLVGERGPELHIPRYSGQVIDAQTTAQILTGGNTTSINVRMDATAEARDPFEVATQLRRLADFKQLAVPR